MEQVAILNCEMLPILYIEGILITHPICETILTLITIINFIFKLKPRTLCFCTGTIITMSGWGKNDQDQTATNI